MLKWIVIHSIVYQRRYLVIYDMDKNSCNIAQLTLNHFRASRRQPTLSAHTAALGTYNFDAHPLAPPGTKVLVHETSEQRGTFDFHGTESWYIGPACDH